MKVVLRVSSNNEYCAGGCELALVDLRPELAALPLGRIATFREQKNLDPGIDETYYAALPWICGHHSSIFSRALRAILTTCLCRSFFES